MLGLRFLGANFFLMIYFGIAIIIFIYTLHNKNNKQEERRRMIKCPDCGRKISINAKMCRYCNSEILQNKEIVEDSIIVNDKKIDYKKKKYILIIYQLLAGIIIVIGYERIDSMIPQILLLLSLIINTVALIVFMIKYNEQRKTIKLRISIISILAIICGVVFSLNYTISFIHKVDMGYSSDIREIRYLNTYDKKEAKDFLQNIYSSLHKDERLDIGSCLSLYGIWEDREKENTYIVNIEETCESSYFPPNAMKIEVNSQDKTKVEKVYWDFNKDIDIVLYENGKQVNDFVYLYNAMLYTDVPPYPIKDYFEQDVKEYLKSPSSATFTYNSFRYLESENRFYFDGWVEAQNSFGAIVKENFKLKLVPCNEEYCDWYSLDYEWSFK